MISTKRDVNIRIAKAWAALNSMNIIWKSKLSTHLKTFFQSGSRISVCLRFFNLDFNNSIRDKY